MAAAVDLVGQEAPERLDRVRPEPWRRPRGEGPHTCGAASSPEMQEVGEPLPPGQSRPHGAQHRSRRRAPAYLQGSPPQHGCLDELRSRWRRRTRRQHRFDRRLVSARVAREESQMGVAVSERRQGGEGRRMTHQLVRGEEGAAVSAARGIVGRDHRSFPGDKTTTPARAAGCFSALALSQVRGRQEARRPGAHRAPRCGSNRGPGPPRHRDSREPAPDNLR
jgi:hypothetical protein